MDVGRSTDGAAGSTDTTAMSAGVVGMEVERPSDGAVGLGRDVTGVTTAGSTDTAAAGAGMDVTTTDGTGGKKKKRRKNKNRKHGGAAAQAARAAGRGRHGRR